MSGLHFRLRTLVACCGLAAAVFLLYSQVAGHGFLNYDDDVYVSDNPQVLHGLTWDGFRWAFVTETAGNWHPLTWLSHMLDVQVHGRRPGGHHVTSVLLHAANAVLLFLVLLSMTGEFGASLAVAALFAVHPLRVESVAWVAERKDVLSASFWLLAIGAYVHYTRKPGVLRYALVFVLMGLGLLAKPMLVTLPFVLLLLDFWPLGRLERGSLRRLVLEKLPLMALAAASSAITLAAQTKGGAVRSMELVPMGARLANAAVSYVTYLAKTIWPSGLAPLYPHPYLLGASQVALAGAALAVLVVATIFAVRLRGRHPYVTVGWLWYLGTLVPVIGIVQVGPQGRADRYAYLPLIGIYIAVVWGVGALLDLRPRFRGVARAVTVLALAGFAWTTWVQIGYWKDATTLYRHAFRVTTGNYLLHNNLGAVLAAEGRQAEALAEYQEALRIEPDFAEAHCNLGLLLKQQGKLAEAEAEYRTAIRLRSDFADPVNNLGDLFAARGDIASARRQFEAALAIRPDYHVALYNLGSALMDQEDFEGAENAFRASLHLEPERPDTHRNLALTLARRGNLEDAVAECAVAIRLRPQDASLRSDLAFFLARQGRLEEAVSSLREALRQAPDSVAIRRRLADLLDRQGKDRLE